MRPVPEIDVHDPLYASAELITTNAVELHQPLKPRPYYVPRGRKGVIVVTLGPGGTQCFDPSAAQRAAQAPGRLKRRPAG
jgi:hypothetical protein